MQQNFPLFLRSGRSRMIPFIIFLFFSFFSRARIVLEGIKGSTTTISILNFSTLQDIIFL